MVQLFSSWACDVCDKTLNNIQNTNKTSKRTYLTKEQAKELYNKTNPCEVYNNNTLPDPTSVIPCTMVFNTDDMQMNYCDGVNWTDGVLKIKVLND